MICVQQCITVNTDAVYMGCTRDVLCKQESILRANACRFINISGPLKKGLLLKDFSFLCKFFCCCCCFLNKLLSAVIFRPATLEGVD